MAYNLTIAKLEDFSDIVEFERLCCDILSKIQKYHFLEPQSVGRKDGGKDAILCFYDNQKIVFHFSMRKDWEKKLNEDKDTVKGLDTKYDEFVFVSNRLIPGIKKDNLKLSFKSDSMLLEIFDQERIRVELDNNRKDLREKYLGIPESDDTSNKVDEIHNILQKQGKKLDFKIINIVIRKIITINDESIKPLAITIPIDIQEKLELNKFSSWFDELLKDQMHRFNEIDEFLRSGVINGKMIEKMVTLLKIIYMKQRSPEKNGDQIFLAMLDELIPTQCTEDEYLAYVTLLCYFFQACEVFESVAAK